MSVSDFKAGAMDPYSNTFLDNAQEVNCPKNHHYSLSSAVALFGKMQGNTCATPKNCCVTSCNMPVTAYKPDPDYQRFAESIIKLIKSKEGQVEMPAIPSAALPSSALPNPIVNPGPVKDVDPEDIYTEPPTYLFQETDENVEDLYAIKQFKEYEDLYGPSKEAPVEKKSDEDYARTLQQQLDKEAMEASVVRVTYPDDVGTVLRNGDIYHDGVLLRKRKFGENISVANGNIYCDGKVIEGVQMRGMAVGNANGGEFHDMVNTENFSVVFGTVNGGIIGGRQVFDQQPVAPKYVINSAKYVIGSGSPDVSTPPSAAPKSSGKQITHDLDTNENLVVNAHTKKWVINGGVNSHITLGEYCENITINASVNNVITLGSYCNNIKIVLSTGSNLIIKDYCNNIDFTSTVNCKYELGSHCEDIKKNGKYIA